MCAGWWRCLRMGEAARRRSRVPGSRGGGRGVLGQPRGAPRLLCCCVVSEARPSQYGTSPDIHALPIPCVPTLCQSLSTRLP